MNRPSNQCLASQIVCFVDTNNQSNLSLNFVVRESFSDQILEQIKYFHHGNLHFIQDDSTFFDQWMMKVISCLIFFSTVSEKETQSVKILHPSKIPRQT